MSQQGAQNGFAQSASALVLDLIGTRRRISIWLDFALKRDVEALEIINSMKNKREFKRSVLLGIKIVSELKQGRVDTLLHEYPDIVEWLQVKLTPPPAPPDNSGLIERLDRMEQMMLSRPIPSGNEGLAMTATAQTGKTLGGFKPLAAPVWDDEDELPALTVAASKAGGAADNFLSSLTAIH